MSNLRLPLAVSDDSEPYEDEKHHFNSILSPRSPRVYLPPYLFHNHELQENIYSTNEEAYMATAKALLHDYTCCGHMITPMQIIIRHLPLVSQRKLFADAHMEEAVTISSYPEQGETAKISIMRQIDNAFGEILLELFASKDGVLQSNRSSHYSFSSPRHARQSPNKHHAGKTHLNDHLNSNSENERNAGNISLKLQNQSLNNSNPNREGSENDANKNLPILPSTREIIGSYYKCYLLPNRVPLLQNRAQWHC